MTSIDFFKFIDSNHWNILRNDFRIFQWLTVYFIIDLSLRNHYSDFSLILVDTDFTVILLPNDIHWFFIFSSSNHHELS